MSNLTWPDGKRSAVMFSFDVDGDTTWENGNRGLPNGDKYIKSLSVGAVWSEALCGPYFWINWRSMM